MGQTLLKNGYIVSMNAVSYTHLDVYKRQARSVPVYTARGSKP